MTCQCRHTASYLIQEISAGRPVHEFRELGGTYVLICTRCLQPWDHAATERLIERVMIPERAPIFEPWE